MIAVCLLTADRPEATSETLRTFLRWNTTLQHILLHADDGSATPVNRALALAAGFETVYQTPERRGQMPALRAMWVEALARGAEQILHLENDQEWVAPIPPSPVEMVDCVRLYGKRKMRGGGPRALTGQHRMGTLERIEWRQTRPGWERGQAHWGGQPSITRADLLTWAAHKVTRVKDLSLRLNELDTLRPVENITWHLPCETTQGWPIGTH